MAKKSPLKQHSPRLRDLTNYRSGRLVVKRYLGKPQVGSSKRGKWECVCDCGKTVPVAAQSLVKAKNPTRSCGCLQRDIASQLAAEQSGKPRQDLTGLKVGRLTVVEFGGVLSNAEDRAQRLIWVCQCECGNLATVRACSLTRKTPTRSCGCLQREYWDSLSLEKWNGRVPRPDELRSRPTTSKRTWQSKRSSQSPKRSSKSVTAGVPSEQAPAVKISPPPIEFSSWLEAEYSGMKRRCEDPNHRYYDLFGGSGIKVGWESFESFEAWVVSKLGVRAAGTKLVRPDRYGNFEPGNLRWCQSI